MSKTKQRSYEWHGSFAMAALSAIQDFWNSDPQYARAKDRANLVEWTIPAEDKEPLPFTWGKIVVIRNLPLYVIMLGLGFSGQILPEKKKKMKSRMGDRGFSQRIV